MRVATRSGLSIAYEASGAGPAILLLHPVGLRGAFWRPVMDALDTEHRLIAPDMRGHGGSDIPDGPFTLSDMADDLADLLRAVGSGPALVVGCSLGGMLAQGLAVRSPELVAGLVISSAGYTRDATGRKTVLARAEAARAGMRAILETTLSRWFSEEVEMADPVMVGTVRNWLLEDDPTVHAQCWEAMADLDFSADLGRIEVPVLAVAATGDQSVAPETLNDLARRVPNGIYREIEGAGHLAPLERPKAFAPLVRDFARQVF